MSEHDDDLVDDHEGETGESHVVPDDLLELYEVLEWEAAGGETP